MALIDFEIIAPGDGSTVVSIRGEFDAHAADEVRRVLTALIRGGRGHLVIDASGVEFLDSTALGVLVGAMKRAEARHHGSFCLLNPSPAVCRVLEVTGLTGLLHECWQRPGHRKRTADLLRVGRPPDGTPSV